MAEPAERPPNPNPAWKRRRFSDRSDVPAGKVDRYWKLATAQYRLTTFTPTVVALMVTLIARADRDTGRASVGRVLLAEIIHRRSVRTVGRALAELVEAGWVEVEHRVEHRMGRLRQLWNLYRVTIPDQIAEAIDAKRAEKAGGPKPGRYQPPQRRVTTTGTPSGPVVDPRPVVLDPVAQQAAAERVATPEPEPVPPAEPGGAGASLAERVRRMRERAGRPPP
jgi:hypothetical protein